jgi:hypothetical protein
MNDSHSLLRIRQEFWTAQGPIVVFNKSHSGSRLLAKVIEASGVFMGAHQNDSKDSLDLLRLIHHLVVNHYPDYKGLLRRTPDCDPAFSALAGKVLASHLEGFGPSHDAQWGWKNCSTGYVLPVVDFLFPNARYIHLIRDGRDIAFSNHHGADTPYRKKVLFNTDQIESWRNYRLTGWAYLRHSHIFNTIHWVNSVEVARAFAEPLGDRHLELRYEDLCQDFDANTRRVLRFIGREDVASQVIDEIAPTVHRKSLHKYENQPRHKLEEVLALAAPLLHSLGYVDG